MNLLKKVTLFGLMALSSQVLATPGVYEINSACLDVGCFSGDDPATRTVEITQRGGTFRLTSDIFVDDPSQDAIEVDRISGLQIITIDLNGFQIRTNDIPASTASGISILKNNTFVTIKNGSITSFNDGIRAVRSAVVNVDNMVFRLMKDDAIQAGRGRITNNSFDCNDYGVNATNLSGTLVGDRLYLENNDFTCISSPDDQQPIFGFANTNICKDNRIQYDAGSNTDFQACLLVGTNVCNGSVCIQGSSIDAVDEIKE